MRRCAALVQMSVAASLMVSLGAACTTATNPSASSTTTATRVSTNGSLAAEQTVHVDDAGNALPAGVTLSPWQELVPGIRLRRGHATEAFDLPGVARPQDLTVADIDLATPGLRFVTNRAGGPSTPERPGHEVHTTGRALSDLVAGRPEILLAVNANFFWPCCQRREAAAVGMTVFGLAVDDGELVSDPAALQHVGGCDAIAAVPDGASVGAPALLIDRSHHASLAIVSAREPEPSNLEAAVAGGPQPDGRTPPPCGSYDGFPPEHPVPGPPFLLRNGEIAAAAAADPPEIVAGRTFVGITREQHLLLATVDGNETSGAAFRDEARWLVHLGAVDGLNLDGGGSSSMVLNTARLPSAAVPITPCPATPPIVLLDAPDNGGRCHERLIGTYLGVVAGQT